MGVNINTGLNDSKEIRSKNQKEIWLEIEERAQRSNLREGKSISLADLAHIFRGYYVIKVTNDG